MIQLLAIDLDGTLLNSFHEISKENIEAIKEAQLHGIKVIIATGRPGQLCKSIVRKLNIDDPIIMSNGGVISHPFHTESMYSKTLNETIVKSVVEYCETFDIIYLIYTKDAIISKPNFRVDFFQNRNKDLPEEEHVVFKDLSEYPNLFSVKPNKILIVEEDKLKFNNAKRYFENIEDTSIVSSQTTFIDVSPKNVSKGIALQFYANHLGLTADEVAAIGDQDNDISMLQFAGMSIAMENASPGCLEVANYTTFSNNNHGVAHAIKTYMLHNRDKMEEKGKKVTK